MGHFTSKIIGAAVGRASFAWRHATKHFNNSLSSIASRGAASLLDASEDSAWTPGLSWTSMAARVPFSSRIQADAVTRPAGLSRRMALRGSIAWSSARRVEPLLLAERLVACQVDGKRFSTAPMASRQSNGDPKAFGPSLHKRDLPGLAAGCGVSRGSSATPARTASPIDGSPAAWRSSRASIAGRAASILSERM